LRILQAICDEAGRRGWKVASSPAATQDESSAAVLIGRHPYDVSLEEQTEAIPFTEEDIRRWRKNRPPWEQRDQPSLQERRRRPTGDLALLLPSAWDGSRARWADGRRGRVEEKLGDFFAMLEVRAARDEEREQQFEQERKDREAREQLARLEKARAERLDHEISASLQADRIRAYVSKVRTGLNDVASADRERLIAWCDWAEARADGMDPATNLGLIAGLDDERDGIGW